MDKNRKSVFLVFALTGSLLSTMFSARGQDRRQEIRAVEIAICTAVQDHRPVGVDSTFGSQVGSLCCFTRIEGAGEPTQVRHIWYHGEKKAGETCLPVKSPNWRTHSKKNILPSQTGRWNVVILSEDGNPLGHISFTIKS